MEAVVSQQLVPALDGSLVPAFEVMMVNPAIRTMIRDNKVHQIDGILATSARGEMFSMDMSLTQLFQKGITSRETALNYGGNPEQMAKKL